jgi:hypothetical protein
VLGALAITAAASSGSIIKCKAQQFYEKKKKRRSKTTSRRKNKSGKYVEAYRGSRFGGIGSFLQEKPSTVRSGMFTSGQKWRRVLK